jgi:hypothetical protein
MVGWNGEEKAASGNLFAKAVVPEAVMRGQKIPSRNPKNSFSHTPVFDNGEPCRRWGAPLFLGRKDEFSFGLEFGMECAEFP